MIIILFLYATESQRMRDYWKLKQLDHRYDIGNREEEVKIISNN